MPQPLIQKEGARVMSLTDGTSKMSKSDPQEMSRINLLDPVDLIAKKIKRTKTDPIKGLTFDDPERPECHNLLTLYSLLSKQSKEAVSKECENMGWGDFKPLLTDVVITALEPIQKRYQEIMADPSYLKDILEQGRIKAQTVAEKNLARVQDALGFLPR